MYDVTIVGGGPAGLSAALILARACRQVVIVDAGKPRNEASPALHGFLSRDGMPPKAFLEAAREELRGYETVHWEEGVAIDCHRMEDGFETVLTNEKRLASRLVLLATGVVDTLPAIPGVKECYGHSVHHCPYCDALPYHGRRIVAYGRTSEAIDFAIQLTAWSREITLCTDGDLICTASEAAELRAYEIAVVPERITALRHENTQVQGIEFAARGPLPCDAFFFVTDPKQASDINRAAGCAIDGGENCVTGQGYESTIRGIFIAGNAKAGFNLIVIAAAEGAKAAISLNERLVEMAAPRFPLR